MARSPWLSRVGMTLLATVSAGAVAGPAHAAGTGVASVVKSTQVQYKAGSGKQNKVVVTRSGNTVTVNDVVTVKAGKGCKPVKGDRTMVRCTTAKAPTRVRVYTYDRYDTILNTTDVRMTADGGTANDRITGGFRGDRISGGSGDDTIDARTGNDYADGGTGNDVISTGDGDDTLHGWTGNDTLRGGKGNDDLFGEAGNDKAYGDAGSDTLHGYQGRDRLEGGAGADVLYGDNYDEGTAADVLLGGPGVDRVDYGDYRKAVTVDLDGSKGDDGHAGEKDTVGADVEDVHSGSGNDRLTGNNANNYLQGFDGDDTIRGGSGDDQLWGLEGRDKLYGDAGDDDLHGEDDREAADRLDGGSNGTPGDACKRTRSDTKVGCER